MEGRFAARREELLAQSRMCVENWEAVVARLAVFVEPFVGSLTEAAQRRHLVEYSSGLLSGLERKTGEGIAYLHGQDRKQMQQFVGESPWEPAPLLLELSRQVAARIGEADGVIVFDPSAFAKKGTKSVGVARQWSGRQGKIDNCQIGSTWVTCRVGNTPWSTCGCTFPKSGRRTGRGVARREFPSK
jgi:SRSO17 transposase